MADKPKIKPGLAGVWIGLLLIVLGTGSCIGGPVWGLAGLIGDISDVVNSAGDRVPVPGTSEFTIKDGNASGIIIGVADTQTEAESISVTLEGPNGPVSMEEASTVSSTGETDGRSWTILGTFSDQPPGSYTVSATGDGGEFAVVPLSIGGVLSKVFGGLAIGAVLVLIGLILFIVTLVRRSRAKKKLNTVGGFGAPPPVGGMPAPGGATPPPPGFPPAAPPAPGGFPPAPPAPPAPGGYPPAAPAPEPYMPPPAPSPEPYSPPPAPAPAAPPPPPPAPGTPPPPPPAPGQWGNDAPPSAPPFQ